eukprot:NODE_2830_length_497_cov_44.924324_g2780_i0.p1 GENE.NODE_2830_length_497_cov_44.924324_g2780_i0~~NODE_2830_length_497_cov_44.924324_g2780_i0.p1  ORF type:complete len:138 (-),score=29.39 NODE_2830_length_497_cov_44.924324_g2780_i0:17-430(-)
MAYYGSFGSVVPATGYGGYSSYYGGGTSFAAPATFAAPTASYAAPYGFSGYGFGAPSYTASTLPSPYGFYDPAQAMIQQTTGAAALNPEVPQLGGPQGPSAMSVTRGRRVIGPAPGSPKPHGVPAPSGNYARPRNQL